MIVALWGFNPYYICIQCREAHDEFQVVANSWRYSNHYTSELFFVMVDIDEGGVEAFQQVRSVIFWYITFLLQNWWREGGRERGNTCFIVSKQFSPILNFQLWLNMGRRYIPSVMLGKRVTAYVL